MNNIKTEQNREVLALDGYINIFDKFSADKQKKYWNYRQKNTC